jgi:hypothetical protein
MKYKTLFRIICKAMGVFFIVSGITGLIGGAGSTIVMYIQLASLSARDSDTRLWSLLSAAGPLFELTAGIYLFFGGRRLADLAVPGNRPYCHECGYDLTSASSSVCPECGTQRPPAKQE